ncbi:MAG: hypothetical protein JO131_06905 [Gammaproteobacteria bacterium]|nr:hypothetical protein [Gammaproteobacteria bacterium]
MLFKKDTFTKNVDLLMDYLTRAESLMEKANNGNSQALNEINKNLEQAPKLLELLYHDIKTQKNSSTMPTHQTAWDNLTLQTRTGQYDNLFIRYKDIQQQLEDLRSQPKFTF